MFPNCLKSQRSCEKKKKIFLKGGGGVITHAWAVPKMFVTTGRSLMPSKASVLRIAESIHILQALRSFGVSSLYVRPGQIGGCSGPRLGGGPMSLDHRAMLVARWLCAMDGDTCCDLDPDMTFEPTGESTALPCPFGAAKWSAW